MQPVEGRCAPKVPSLRSDTKAPSKPHGLTQTLFLAHSTRYEEELSLRPCAENEFVALKKVRSWLREGESPRSWPSGPQDTQPLDCVQTSLQPTHPPAPAPASVTLRKRGPAFPLPPFAKGRWLTGLLPPNSQGPKLVRVVSTPA